MPYQTFDDITQQYSRAGQFEVQPNCNSILFTNIGGDPVEVNDKLLLPGTLNQLSTTSNILGDSFSLGGNENEVYSKKTFTVKFLGIGSLPLIEVTQKYYRK